MAKGSKVLVVKRERSWTKVTSDRDVAIERHGQVVGFLCGVVFALVCMLISVFVMLFMRRFG